jgi:hypothetical protein
MSRYHHEFGVSFYFLSTAFPLTYSFSANTSTELFQPLLDGQRTLNMLLIDYVAFQSEVVG